MTFRHVFVLCTGRCGSQTVARACGHIANWTSGHESRTDRLRGRLNYPDRHIEVDNRLAWLLGQLPARFDDDTTLYVHLRRNPDQVAESYSRRFHVKAGIMPAFGAGIIRGRSEVAPKDRLQAARLFTSTVEANIVEFLRHRPHTLTMHIEQPHEPFDQLWEAIGATGDRDAAHRTLDKVHNARRKR